MPLEHFSVETVHGHGVERVVVGYHLEEAITDCDSAFGHDGEHVRPGRSTRHPSGPAAWDAEPDQTP